MSKHLPEFKSFPAIYSEGPIILEGGRITLEEYFYKRIFSNVGRHDHQRYFYIEQILLNTCFNCSPNSANLNTYSLAFETVIKESCAFIEVILKRVMTEFYPESNDQKLFKLLKLDDHMLLSRRSVDVIGFNDVEAPIKIRKPFFNMEGRTLGTEIEKSQIPSWWESYNTLKHESGVSEKNATLENAFSSLAALFLVLHRVYGPGMVSGVLINSESIILHRKESQLFYPVNFNQWETQEYLKHNWQTEGTK